MNVMGKIRSVLLIESAWNTGNQNMIIIGMVIQINIQNHFGSTTIFNSKNHLRMTLIIQMILKNKSIKIIQSQIIWNSNCTTSLKKTILARKKKNYEQLFTKNKIEMTFLSILSNIYPKIMRLNVRLILNAH